MTEKITSRNNGRIKTAAELLKSASARREKGLFLIEGTRLCRDAFLSGMSFDCVFFTAEAMRKYPSELSFIKELDAPCFEINEDVAPRLSDTKSPQGIFCICKTLDKISNIDKIKHNGFYLALDNIQTPDNLGAIIRTAEALGLDGIISCGGCDVYNPKVQRAAMGAALRMNVLETDNLPGLLKSCVLSGMPCFATVPDCEAVPISDVDFSGGAVCVIGNEGAGISEEVLAVCNKKITIPMRGRSESLNAAAAAAIVIWEMRSRN